MATVLLADTDEARLRALRVLVRREGHRTLLAMDGASALDKARRSRPAALVARVGLGDLDGYRLALSLREELPADTVRVILLKAGVGPEDRTTAQAVGADAVRDLDEPPDRLMEALRRLLATRRSEGGGLTGQADQEALFALLQFLHGRRDTGTLSLAGESAGTVVFEEGEILGARAGDLEGLPGLLALLRNPTARYCFDRGPVDPSARTLDRAFDPLLMDAIGALG